MCKMLWFEHMSDSKTSYVLFMRTICSSETYIWVTILQGTGGSVFEDEKTGVVVTYKYICKWHANMTSWNKWNMIQLFCISVFTV